MTTELKSTVNLDLSEENDEPRLPPPTSGAPAVALAAITVLCPVEPDLVSSRLVCLRHLDGLLERACPSHRLWLFVIHTLWQSDTRLRRHKKLWRGLGEAGVELPRERTSEEILESRDGIKFYGAANVGRDDLAKVGDILAREPGSLLVSAPRDQRPPLRELLAAGWASGHHASLEYWRDLAVVAACHDDILFRPVGAFDDREAGFSLISIPGVVRRIAPDQTEVH